MKKIFIIAAAALIVSVSAGFVFQNQGESTPVKPISEKVGNKQSEVGQIETNPARWD